ncbi:MAG: hypothetical protein JO276_10850 [Sphingomonadaceae bacterium]|nr:hypothetical protein [Sphingomonadaceae bacterium]
MADGTLKRGGFAPQHRHDRTMIAATVLAIWLAILLGFGIDLVKRAHGGALTFPLITHLHVVAYTGWLVLLAAQVWLVRTGRTAAHRRLGLAALILLPAMAVLGPATAYYGVADNPYMPDKWIAWLSVNYTNAIGAVVLLAAGFLLRRDPAAHKRLMVMGTIALTEPGFSRIWEPFLEARLGEGYLPFYVSTYVGTFLLVLAVGAYDLATRRRLHPAYVAAALWIFANQALADWLFHQPFWLAAMKQMTGHPV